MRSGLERIGWSSCGARWPDMRSRRSFRTPSNTILRPVTVRKSSHKIIFDLCCEISVISKTLLIGCFTGRPIQPDRPGWASNDKPSPHRKGLAVKGDILKTKKFHLLCIASVIWLGYSVITGLKQRSTKLQVAPPQAADFLKVVCLTWRKGGFGNVAILGVTFKNKSSRPIGNIRYTVDYYTETGGYVSRPNQPLEWVLHKVIPPGESRYLSINDGFVNDQAERAKFSVHGCEFAPASVRSSPLNLLILCKNSYSAISNEFDGESRLLSQNRHHVDSHGGKEVF